RSHSRRGGQRGDGSPPFLASGASVSFGPRDKRGRGGASPLPVSLPHPNPRGEAAPRTIAKPARGTRGARAPRKIGLQRQRRSRMPRQVDQRLHGEERP